MAFPYNSKFRLTSGYRTSDRPNHTGVDLVGVDKNICAVVGGIVGAATIVKDKNNATWQWGNYVRIDGDDGKYYYYCHMASSCVKTGQRVKTGDYLGIEGSTGYSTGSHLHLEIRSGVGSATAINPAELLDIPNTIGIYGEDYRAMCGKRFGLDETTLRYMDGYKHAAALYYKLASR
jgi:murein DD-endopeptidase MepM/ murein hydrolase activator NlpD